MAEPEQIICVTTDTVPGRSIRQVLGIVWGIGTAGWSISRPSRQFEWFETADRARHEAYAHLVAWARSMGANAVVSVGMDSLAAGVYESVEREYAIYGTAVVLE